MNVPITSVGDSSERPLASLLVIAYNQERFVADAVEGALGQSYSPLEVILSDDHSDDDTFSIMETIAGQYRGPHIVRLNRNPENKGLVGHVNIAFSLARGDLLVATGGDDVSFPQRTQVLVDAWVEHGRVPDGLCSGYVGVTGPREVAVAPTRRFAADNHCSRGTSNVLGATAAWTRRLWERWGDLPDDGLVEDRIMTLRALLGGGIVSVGEPLVRCWRYDEPPVISRLDRLLWNAVRTRAFLEVYERDVRRWGTWNEGYSHEAARLICLLQRSRRRALQDVRGLSGCLMPRLTFCSRFLVGQTIPPGSQTVTGRVKSALDLLLRVLLGARTSGTIDATHHRALRGES